MYIKFIYNFFEFAHVNAYKNIISKYIVVIIIEIKHILVIKIGKTQFDVFKYDFSY